jgi:hypothetical protein
VTHLAVLFIVELFGWRRHDRGGSASATGTFATTTSTTGTTGTIATGTIGIGSEGWCTLAGCNLVDKPTELREQLLLVGTFTNVHRTI